MNSFHRYTVKKLWLLLAAAGMRAREVGEDVGGCAVSADLAFTPTTRVNDSAFRGTRRFSKVRRIFCV